jgi:ribonuclease HII
MTKLSEQFPGYGWHTNVGYPTIQHREAIKRLGVTLYHRKSFQLLPIQTELFK